MKKGEELVAELPQDVKEANRGGDMRERERGGERRLRLCVREQGMRCALTCMLWWWWWWRCLVRTDLTRLRAAGL